MEKEKTLFRSSAEDNYARRGFESDRVPENLLPSWIWSIGIYSGLAEEAKRKVESGQEQSTGLVGQLTDKFSVISQSLRFSNEDDVEAFETMLISIRHFWPEVGAFREKATVVKDAERNSHVIESDQKIFSDQVEKWLNGDRTKESVSAEAISSWFDGIGGLVCSDPTIVKKFFSSEAVYDIPPLVGLETKANRYPGSTRDVDQTWALENIRIFSGGCADILENRVNSLRESMSDLELADKLETVAVSARSLNKFLGSAREGSYREMDITRPTPPANIVKPVGIALYEKLEKLGAEVDSQETVSKIARSMVRIFRTKRVNIGREGILGFCSSFVSEDKVRAVELPLNGAYVGLGLEEVRKVKGKNGRPLDLIQSEIIPEFVYQMRLMGYQTFEWNSDDYKNLGMGDLWEEHNERLKESSNTIPNEGIVQKGDVCVEFSGELDPIHEGHIQFLWEVAEDMEPGELEHVGFIPRNHQGGWRVGINVNTGNKVKAGKSKDALDRAQVVSNSLLNIKDVFIHQLTESSLSTADRMDAFKAVYKGIGGDLSTQIRLTGLDKIDPESAMYTERLEPGGSERLNSTPQMFSVQLAHLDDPFSLTNDIKAVFKRTEAGQAKFDGKVMVLLVHLPEVHSSFIKYRLSELSDEVLATLIHPRNIQKVRELYDPRFIKVQADVMEVQ